MKIKKQYLKIKQTQHIKKTEHPTEKPLNIFTDLIQKYSKENDLILNCFLGSGTTAYACEQLKWKWLGCEINSNYLQLKKIKENTN